MIVNFSFDTLFPCGAKPLALIVPFIPLCFPLCKIMFPFSDIFSPSPLPIV